MRYARAPEDKKKTFPEHLDAELAALVAVRPDLALVALAAGAAENWRYCERPVSANATQIVDHGHASQPLQAGRAADYGAKSVAGRAEDARLRLIRRDQRGGVDQVITDRGGWIRKMGGKRRKRRRKRLGAELPYFKNQRERMPYAD